MIKVPVLAVLNNKGIIAELEIEVRDGDGGTLFLDAELGTDEDSRRSIKNAFSLLQVKNADVLVRLKSNELSCLCGGSLALPVYLGMYACLNKMEFKPRTFATGCISEKSEITPIGGLAEKIKAVLGKADLLLVPKGQGLPVEGIRIKEVSNLKQAIEKALCVPNGE